MGVRDEGGGFWTAGWVMSTGDMGPDSLGAWLKGGTEAKLPGTQVDTKGPKDLLAHSG